MACKPGRTRGPVLLGVESPMPWNDQSNSGPPKGGPWGNGPRQQPWGQGQRPGASDQGPDIEELLRRFGSRWRGPFGGGRRGGLGGDGGGRSVNGLAVAGALLAAGWAASGVYVVDEGEQAVVTRFGAYTGSPKMAGLHWHLPFPMEQVRVEKVTVQRQTPVGYDEDRDVLSESLMITGDESIADIDFTVVWQLQDLEKYVFNLRSPEEAVKAVAESAMREVVGQRRLDAIITTDRSAVEQSTRDLMQRTLDAYQSGVLVSQIQLRKAAPPATVDEAFKDVVRANQDAETKINEATRYRNEVVPQARGEAASSILEAEGYRERVVREASGETQRFISVLDEYRKSPRVTRERLYLETMERVYGGADKIIVDTRGTGAQPYLPLDQLRRQTQQVGAPTPR